MDASFRQLLVHIDGTLRSAHRLELACALAAAHDARVHALYAATPNYVAMPYPGGMTSEWAVQLQELDVQKRRDARARFDAAAVKAATPPSWGEIGDVFVAPSFAQQARHADLLVLGQHAPHDSEPNDVPPDFVESVLLLSGRPGLIVPYTGSFGFRFENVLIAWKDSAESARAVAAALPILQRARQVHVQCWAPQMPTVAGATLGIEGYLGQHGIRAQMHVQAAEPEALGELLLSRACDLQADLLVMGCYGHSRAREWLLGGVSRTLLGAMTLPVLMAH